MISSYRASSGSSVGFKQLSKIGPGISNGAKKFRNSSILGASMSIQRKTLSLIHSGDRSSDDIGLSLLLSVRMNDLIFIYIPPRDSM